jgi:hypothetical protein
MANWSRRAVMGAGGALALGGPAIAQEVGAAPLRVRRSVQAMGPNDPDLQALARAMTIMLARNDALSWQTQIQIHDTYWGQHGTWRFLPWHRCQMYWFERIVAALSGKADFAMPYWDWQANGKLAPAFLDPSSPFFHAGRNPDLAAFDFVRNREQLWQGDWANVFQGSFNSFVGFAGDSGAVETSGHSYVHVMVGGDMGDPATAPKDPLFWFHHANIDRVWAAWQTRAEARGVQMDEAWLAEPFDMFADERGANARTLTTGDVRATSLLGYRYDLDYPFQWFDERPAIAPAGKTRRNVVATHPYRFNLTVDPGTATPLRLPLPADLVAMLAADQGQRFQVSGLGHVRTTDMTLAGSAFSVAVERIRKDGTSDTAPVAFLLPFVGMHGGGATAPAAQLMPPMAGMPAAPATGTAAGTTAPSAGGMPHEHGFLFNVGPEIYDATGKEPAVEIAVTASSRWVKPSTAPTPTISGLELDLTVTEYAWS